MKALSDDHATLAGESPGALKVQTDVAPIGVCHIEKSGFEFDPPWHLKGDHGKLLSLFQGTPE